jgi:ABC-type transport system involved in multi-copper enzyme maturation permease subunit
MFILLLVVTFVIAVFVSFVVVRLFEGPIRKIIGRIITDEISAAWVRYLKFAIYVVGVSGGVRVWQLERYITPEGEETEPILLTTARWSLELYKTVIGTLQSVAWMLLIFFLIALVAYALRTSGLGRGPASGADAPGR